MVIEKSKYEKIIDVINEPYIDRTLKPNFYGKHILPDKALILLDTPRKEGAYHGSSLQFNCRRDICSISGEVIVERDLEKDTSNKVESHDCTIREIHQHPESILATVPGREEQRKESHIHFTCADKRYSDTINIAKFLREY